MAELVAAPEWITGQWLNSEPLTLAGLRGSVVVAGAFQMLCPGCVTDLIPQLRKAHAIFAKAPVKVIGLHMVFEHHDAMTPVSLRAFLHENRVTFPVAVDASRHPTDPIPETMALYGMQGTPTMMLIDKAGNLRRLSFGHVEDMALGAEIASLLTEG
jgi:peroxiredoxin